MMSPNLCRICLNTLSDKSDYYNIFSKQNGDSFYSTKMTEITNIQINNNGSLPQNICLACAKSLDSAVNLKAQIEQSEEFLQNVSSEVKPISREEGAIRATILRDENDDNLIERSYNNGKCDSDSECNIEKNEESISFGNQKSVTSPFESNTSYPEADNCALKKTKVDELQDGVVESNQVIDVAREKININERLNEISKVAQTSYFETKKKSDKINSQDDRTDHQCNICGAAYRGKYTLWKHKLSQHNIKDFEKLSCDICGLGFQFKKRLILHKKIEHKSATGEDKISKFGYQCDICGHKYRQKSSLYRHRKWQHMTKKFLFEFSCDICGLPFKHKGRLAQHKRLRHNPAGNASQVSKNIEEYNEESISIGNKKTTVDDVLDDLVRSNRVIYVDAKNQDSEIIKIAGKEEQKFDEILKVKQTCYLEPYIEEKGITCPKRAIMSKKRKSKHTDYDISTKRALRSRWNSLHTQKFHGDKKRKKYFCQDCSKMFSRRYMLKRHMLKHTGYQCNICGTKFTRKSSMVRHSKFQHMTKSLEELSCKICRIVFRHKGRLTLHKSTKHKSKEQSNDVSKNIKCNEESISLGYQVSAASSLESNTVCPEADNCAFLKTKLDDLQDHLMGIKEVINVEPEDQDCESIETKEEFHEIIKVEQTSYIPSNIEENMASEEDDHHDAQCNICEKTFSRKSFMEKHKITQHGAKHVNDLSCNICGQSFKLIARLILHKNIKHKITEKSNDLYANITCNEESISLGYQISAASSLDSDTIFPEADNFEFKKTKVDNLQDHIVENNQIINVEREEQYCETIEIKQEFDEIIKVEETSYLPSNNEEENMTSEKDDHPDPQCNICGKYFSLKSSLERHMIALHAETQHNELSCNICGQAFKLIARLTMHKKIKHNPTEQFNHVPKNIEYNEESISLENKKSTILPLSSNNTCPEANNCGLMKTTKVDDLQDDVVGSNQLISVVREKIEIKEKIDKISKVVQTSYFEAKKKSNKTNSRDDRTDHQCNICGAAYKRKYTLWKHKLSQHNINDFEKLSCDICGLGFQFKKRLILHKKTEHKSAIEEDKISKLYQCDVESNQVINVEDQDGEIVESEDEFNEIIKVEPISYTEPYIEEQNNRSPEEVTTDRNICSKNVLAKQSNSMCKQEFERAKSPTNTEKNFSCTDCNKIFKHKYMQKRHMLLHTGLPPGHQCNVCEKYFARKSSLVRHRIAQHALLCKKEFERAKNPTNTEKDLSCTDCNKIFKQRYMQKRHMLLRTGLSPDHQCKICEKYFTRKSTLVRHRIAQHAIKGLNVPSCDACGLSFDPDLADYKNIIYAHVFQCPQSNAIVKLKVDHNNSSKKNKTPSTNKDEKRSLRQQR